MPGVMKSIFFVSIAAFFSGYAFADNSCASIDPTVAARLVDFMPVAAVDAAIGCHGKEEKSATMTDFDGSVITGRSYSDYQWGKDYQTVPMNWVSAIFRNGRLMQAISVSCTADRHCSSALKATGYLPSYSTCVNYVCTP